MENHLKVLISIYRPALSDPHHTHSTWQAYPTILTYQNSLGLSTEHWSPVAGKLQHPSPIFTDTAKSPAFRLTPQTLSTESGQLKQVSCPMSSETPLNTLTFILLCHLASHRHASKVQCFCGRSNNGSNMTRQCGYCGCGWHTLPLLICSTPSWLSGSRTRFLWVGRQVLLPVGVHHSDQAQACPSWEGSAVAEDCDDWIGLSPVWLPGWREQYMEVGGHGL